MVHELLANASLCPLLPENFQVYMVFVLVNASLANASLLVQVPIQNFQVSMIFELLAKANLNF